MRTIKGAARTKAKRRIYRKAKGCEIIMSAKDDGSSPDSLSEPADVIIYVDDEKEECGQWYDGIRIGFPTAKKAMKWMAKIDVEGFRS